MIIGVGIKDYKVARQGAAADAHAAYLATMAEFVSWLRERGYGVRLLIGDIRYDTDVRQDLIGRICHSTTKAGGIVSEPAPTVEELMRQLADTDAVVSPRFHNLVLALLLNKPVLALSDHPKIDSLMAGLDLDRYCLPLNELTTDDLREKFLQLECEAEKMRPYVRKKVEEYQVALGKQFACALARARG
jgi:polysaccharide pyruvyl transferase WcaK-like protein